MSLVKLFLTALFTFIFASGLSQALAQTNEPSNWDRTPMNIAMERMPLDDAVINSRFTAMMNRDNELLDQRFKEHMPYYGEKNTSKEMTAQMWEEKKRERKAYDEKMRDKRMREHKAHYDKVMTDHKTKPVADSKMMDERLRAQVMNDDKMLDDRFNKMMLDQDKMMDDLIQTHLQRH